jgi:acetyl-CoA decarbonylase/synthase complex subunit delta
MALNLKPKTWPGRVREVTLGAGSREALTVGGGKGLPLHGFEATFPHRPLLALEVTDVDPMAWASTVRAPWNDVLGKPAAAARRAMNEFGADLVMLNLTGTHPDRGDRTPEQAAADVRAILDAVRCPVIVKGSGAGTKQNDVLSRVAESANGEGLILHAACPEDYKTLAAVSVLTGGLGYGLEYTYSVMERIRLAALAGEAMLSCPVLCLVGEEAWKTKEAKTLQSKEPSWGQEGARGVHWEVGTALPLLLAGADILVLRHPEALACIRRQIDLWFPKNGV